MEALALSVETLSGFFRVDIPSKLGKEKDLWNLAAHCCIRSTVTSWEDRLEKYILYYITNLIQNNFL